MPSRNSEPYLPQTLTSIKNQSFKDWELIIVDDHSTDESLKIATDFSMIEQRCMVITNEGNGILDALHTGYKKSTGLYISRMDADDLMPVDKLDNMIRTFEQQEDHVATGYVQYFSDGVLNQGYINYQNWLNALIDQERHYQEIYKECVIPSPAWMMHKSTFDKIGGFGNNYPEDYDLSFRIYQNRIPIVGIKKIVHLWRDHAERTSRNSDTYAQNSFFDIKTKYFESIDYDASKPLVLWGTGKKGKEVARKLKKQSVEFTWCTNNEKKIDHLIYDIQITAINTINFERELAVIIAVSGPEDQQFIQSFLAAYPKIRTYWFC